MDPGPLRDVLTVVVGVFTGVLSGLFGVGGAVISTPGIRLLGASAALAVGTTLPSIFPGAASGVARYHRQRLIDWRAVSATAPAGVVAAAAGGVTAHHVPGNGHLLMFLTAALLGWSGARMMRGAGPPAPPAAESDAEAAPDEEPAGPTRHPPGRSALVGVMAGFMSGLLGVGGGIVMVPLFTQWLGMHVKQAIGSSLACVSVFAVSGTVTHALQGGVDWRFGLLLAVGTIPGAQLGAALAIRADARRLRLAVGAFLVLTAVLYAAEEITAL